MKLKNTKNNRAFVLLFVMMLVSIILIITFAVMNIAIKESKFGVSAKDTNEAFFAADSGIECALFYDKSTNDAFPIIVDSTGNYPNANINCNGNPQIVIPDDSFLPDGELVWEFSVSDLGNSGDGCARIKIIKQVLSPFSVLITSTGYNVADSNCDPIDGSVERVIETSY